MDLQSLPERLQQKIFINPNTGCWIWTAFIHKVGYGQLTYRDKTQWAHRFIYELLIAPISKGLELHHVCNTRACVNPGHLRVLDRKAHIAVSPRPPKEQCKNGHVFSPGNTIIERNPKGRGWRRRCRICKAMANKRYDVKNGRRLGPKTHCKNGHEFTPANTYLWRGWRYCRSCKREAKVRWRSKQHISDENGAGGSTTIT